MFYLNTTRSFDLFSNVWISAKMLNVEAMMGQWKFLRQNSYCKIREKNMNVVQNGAETHHSKTFRGFYCHPMNTVTSDSFTPPGDVVQLLLHGTWQKNAVEITIDTIHWCCYFHILCETHFRGPSLSVMFHMK